MFCIILSPQSLLLSDLLLFCVTNVVPSVLLSPCVAYDSFRDQSFAWFHIDNKERLYTFRLTLNNVLLTKVPFPFTSRELLWPWPVKEAEESWIK
uniref:Putative secreted protein n=1 Tax=Anopheles marajoara TaxID=58244 RepID=A0A2M4CAE7_9DIPT